MCSFCLCLCLYLCFILTLTTFRPYFAEILIDAAVEAAKLEAHSWQAARLRSAGGALGGVARLRSAGGALGGADMLSCAGAFL